MVDTDEPHLLVVDDDERIRTLLSRFLAAQGFRVTSAENAADAAAKMASVSFDLLIVDVMMPGQNGFDFVGELRKRQDHVPVILLTARGEAEDRIKGLETGADDYLPKPFEPRELTLRVNAILKRAVRPAPATTNKPISFGNLVFDPVRGDLKRGEEVVPLTTGEAQLLRILSKAPGTTVPRAALAEPGTNGESRAVDVQITRLRRKIEPDPRNPRYLQTVWGEGYVLWTD